MKLPFNGELNQFRNSKLQTKNLISLYNRMYEIKLPFNLGIFNKMRKKDLKMLKDIVQPNKI